VRLVISERWKGSRIGAMRVLLISSNTERINMVTLPLGLGFVAAATRRAGHEVSVVDALREPDPVLAIQRSIAAFEPNVIGISVRNIDDQARDAPRFLLAQVQPLVEACRASSHAPIVLGGAGFSVFPEAALRYLGADLGVQGDGEVVFPELLRRLEEGKDPHGLAGVHVRGRNPGPEPSFSKRLDSLPQWDEALQAAADPAASELWVPVQTRRGCPNDCSYCATAHIQGRRIRIRPVGEVADHVARLAGLGYRRLYFVDNSFNIPEPYALDLCGALRRCGAGLEWRCILYPQDLREELAAAMAEAGCVEVSLGFESGSLPVLREMGKRFTPEDVRDVSDRLSAHGIRRMGFLLLGGPGETRETVEESLAFAASLRLDALRVTVGIRIYPGTKLARRAVTEGLLRPQDDLLLPRFYLAPGLEPWIHDRVAALR
jgi:radical SAM superfamily enzyme YgiQ (UPF0313 family)